MEDNELTPIFPNVPNKKLRGIGLTFSVYQELQQQLGDQFSAVELMRAAQDLIRLSKGEYTDQVALEYTGGVQFYAMNVSTALELYPWHVACFENVENDEDFPDYPDQIRELLKEANMSMDTTVWETPLDD